ncbi:MAG: acyl carrier protein [Clostridia bacterium]|nr:acyl carrier protein [Clostridia bacterium]
MQNDICLKLIEIVIKNSKLKISAEDIEDNSDLITEFGYDSVLFMQLLAEVEKEFGFQFEDEELNLKLLTRYGGLRESVLKKLG